MVPWILVAIFVLLVVFGVLAIVLAKKGKGKQETDYYVFFILGISWLPLGVVFTTSGIAIGNVFFVLGLVYMAIGILNKDKWKNHKSWGKLDKKEKKFKLAVLLILGILVLAGLVVLFLTEKGII